MNYIRALGEAQPLIEQTLAEWKASQKSGIDRQELIWASGDNGKRVIVGTLHDDGEGGVQFLPTKEVTFPFRDA